jgi:hypothetical protein
LAPIQGCAGRDNARHLGLHGHAVQQLVGRQAGRIDHVVRNLGIQGIPRLEQLAQPLGRVVHLQQGPGLVVAQALVQLFGRGLQIEHMAVLVQHLAVGLAQHRATASGQNPAWPLSAHSCAITACSRSRNAALAVGRKEVAHRAARARFDFMVGVDEGNPPALGQMPSHG